MDDDWGSSIYGNPQSWCGDHGFRLRFPWKSTMESLHPRWIWEIYEQQARFMQHAPGSQGDTQQKN